MWLGSLALAGAPGFAGFFSKDAIIEAVGESHRWGAGYAYACVYAGVFVTALYSFRLLYMTFHGKERFVVETHHGHGHDHHGDHGHHEPGHLEHAPHESPWVITLPLVLLAIPSVVIGWFTVGPMLFGGWFGNAIRVREANDVLGELAKEFEGPMHSVLGSFGLHSPFWPALAGFAVATYIWLLNPGIADKAKNALRPLYTVLAKKYGIDELYQAVFARGGVALGRALWKGGDVGVIDGVIVNGSAAVVARVSSTVRWLQSGYLYHYAFAMILGLIALLGGLWYALGAGAA
jgi:NADH-quinone oxidoreductase subunit L